MPGEKRFRNSTMGFNREDVTAYIEKIMVEYDNKLKDKEVEIAALKSDLREYKQKYEVLFQKAEEVKEERDKIATVMLKAQEQACLIVEEAQIRALEEKEKYDLLIGEEKARLADIRRYLTHLKSEVIDTMKKVEGDLEEYIEEAG